MVLVNFLCFKYKRYWISLLSIGPTLLIAYAELFGPKTAEAAHIHIDYLAILMCIIVGVIGGLIAIYAGGYLIGYHEHHKEVEDRRHYFMMLLFIFLGAMFGFVTSESLMWIELFWEMTSICSFLLIGYTRTEEAIRNSFRALWMNLLGGTGLAIGIVYFIYHQQSASLSELVGLGAIGNIAAVIPVALIAFAALTKSAQMPFSTWLIGAMVAPTPSSALLHSATMVKAGIYILFRLSPAMTGTMTGTMIAFIGGFTFLVASFIAIAQSDGKKVLAYSTISNLGLMVACAGVGTPTTIWAGVFLMIFHAISKSLLFQDVGATENAIHSRDIEDMHGLLFRLPTLAIFMFIGIAAMFLAPFGMLISKWSALRACVDAHNIILVLFIVFGSATTSLYWTKWMGKIISRSHMTGEKLKDLSTVREHASMWIHAILMILVCALFPLLSQVFVSPMLIEIFGVEDQVLSTAILILLVVIILFVFAVPALSYVYGRSVKINRKLSYMSGINTGEDRAFTDSFGEDKQLWLSNMYLEDLVGQKRLLVPSQVLSLAVLLVMLSLIVGGVLS
jgi:ech hydrogenase subunit A